MSNKLIPKLFIATLLGFLVSLGFNFFFLHLSDRPRLDQVLAVLGLTFALWWVFFTIWENKAAIRFRWNLHISLSIAPLRDKAAGLILALFFFFVYFCFGVQLRNFSARQVDNLFDADSAAWIHRIASPDGGAMEMRGPHPFAYFIFRPFGWFLNLFTHDPFLSALLLNTLVGGVCVFLAWLFIKSRFENKVYAFLVSSLLGLSTSHLVSSSVVETYIFSAFALILFCALLGQKQVSLPPLVASGALTFGITLTNFVQNVIAFLIARPRWKDGFRFVGWVLSVSFVFTYLHAVWYPSSRLFFLPSDAQGEGVFFASLLQPPYWRVAGRVLLLLRTVLFSTVIAPKFYVLTEGLESALPTVRFFRITPGAFRFGGYDVLGKILVVMWACMLLAAAIMVTWKFIRTRKADLSLAFALCIAFNLALHFVYGEDPFLYSPNWAYALVFFAAFGLAPWMHNRIFQVGFSIFLVLLAYHQWTFLATLLQTLLPYMG